MMSKGDDDPQGGAPVATTTYNLLFVCTGNTCRSPMAAALARAAIAARGWHNVSAQSAGASAGAGSPATQAAIDVAAEQGLDLTEHRTQPLSAALVTWADAIIAMSDWHAERVAELGGGAKVALASEFIEGASPGSGIPDPIGMDISAYRETRDVLSDVVDGVLDRLEAILAP